MKNIVIAAAALLLVGGGYFAFTSMSQSPAPTPTPAAQIDEQMEEKKMGATGATANAAMESKEYTLEDIALHAKPDDCWFAVSGKVYDVTKFIDGGKHPGGAAILQGCGRDATELFNTKGSKGQPHSEKATAGLENFVIGTLAK